MDGIRSGCNEGGKSLARWVTIAIERAARALRRVTVAVVHYPIQYSQVHPKLDFFASLHLQHEYRGFIHNMQIKRLFC